MNQRESLEFSRRKCVLHKHPGERRTENFRDETFELSSRNLRAKTFESITAILREVHWGAERERERDARGWDAIGSFNGVTWRYIESGQSLLTRFTGLKSARCEIQTLGTEAENRTGAGRCRSCAISSPFDQAHDRVLPSSARQRDRKINKETKFSSSSKQLDRQ